MDNIRIITTLSQVMEDTGLLTYEAAANYVLDNSELYTEEMVDLATAYLVELSLEG